MSKHPTKPYFMTALVIHGLKSRELDEIEISWYRVSRVSDMLTFTLICLRCPEEAQPNWYGYRTS